MNSKSLLNFAIMNPFYDIEITEDCKKFVLPEMDEGYFILNGIMIDGEIELTKGDVLIYKRSVVPKDFVKRRVFWPRNPNEQFEN